MPYNPDIHHRRSIRLAGYDYKWAGAYFVTICAYQKEMLFVDQRFAAIVEECWLAIPEHYPQCTVDEYVVMPNHFHGIVWIAEDGAISNAERAHHDAPVRRPTRKRGSLGAIVLQFKSAAARRINLVRGTPGSGVWHRNYYERIVRNEDELNRIRRYICDNPAKWEEDKDNPAVFALDSGVRAGSGPGRIMTRPYAG